MDKKNKIGFLILHYLTIDITNKCVDSILENIDTKDFCIIIVDNGSPNGTGEILKKIYRDNDRVTVILEKTNLGFARGNNVGFQYAKEVEKCNFICMLNNDTQIKQKNFINSLLNEYHKYKYAVVGPQIRLLDGSVSPQVRRLGTIKMYQKEKIRIQLAYIMIHFGIDLAIFPKLYRKIFKRGMEAYFPVCIKNGYVEDVVLEGCCLIFTPVYLEKFSGIDDRTFMYREEELLYIRLLKNNMKSLYSENIWIDHLENGSTDVAYKRNKVRKIFQYKNQIQSLKILIKEMKEI